MGFLSNIIGKIKNNFQDDEGLFQRGKFAGFGGNSFANSQLNLGNSNIPLRPQQTSTQRPTFQQAQVEPQLNLTKPTESTSSINNLKNRIKSIQNTQLNVQVKDPVPQVQPQRPSFMDSTISKIYNDKGIVRQGSLKPFAPIDDMIKKPVNNFINKNTIFADPTSNNGDNFWGENGRGSRLIKTPTIRDISPVGFLDQTTKNVQAFSPYVNQLVNKRDDINSYIDRQPRAKWLGENVIKPAANTGISLLDQLNQTGTNFSDAYRDLAYNTDGDKNPIRNIAQILKSSAGAYGIGTGRTLIPSFLNSTSKTNFTKALTSAYTDIVSGTTQQGNTGGDGVDAMIGRFIGGIAGWRKNPINEAGAMVLDKFIPYKDIVNPETGKIITKVWNPIKNKLVNFIVTRGSRGMVEDLIDNLSRLEDDKTDTQNTVTFVKNELMGALSEIVSEKAMDASGKFLNKLYTGNLANSVNNFFDKNIEGDGGKRTLGQFFGNQYVKIANNYNQKIDNLKDDKKKDFTDINTFIPNPSNPKNLINPNFIDPKTGKPRLLDNSDFNQMMGLVGGVETYTDEDGKVKVRFNSEKAALGVILLGGVKNVAKTDAGKQLLEKIKLPEGKGADVALRLFNAGKQTISDEKFLIKRLKNNGYDVSKITLKGEPTKLSDVLSKHKVPDKPVDLYVSGQRVPVESLMAEKWNENQINQAMKKLEADGVVPPGKLDSWIRKALVDLNPKDAIKIREGSRIPLGEEPSEYEIARMDRNAGNLPSTKVGEADRPFVTKPLEEMMAKKTDTTAKMVDEGKLKLDMEQVPKGAKLLPDKIRYSYKGRIYAIPLKVGEVETPKKIADLPKVDNKPVKTKPEVSKSTTQVPIVNSRASSEAVKPKNISDLKSKEVISPQQQKIRDANNKVIEDFKNGKFSNPPKKVDYKSLGQDSKRNYKNIDVNDIKDVELRARVRDAKSFDSWWDEKYPDKKYPTKSENKWAEVAKIEEKIRNGETWNLGKPKAEPKKISQIPSKGNDDYDAFDKPPSGKKASSGDKPPETDFTKTKRKIEKVEIKDEDIQKDIIKGRNVLNKLIGKHNQAGTQATMAVERSGLFEIGKNKTEDIISAIEKTDGKSGDYTPEELANINTVKEFWKQARKIGNDMGLNINETKNYFTHIYDENLSSKGIGKKTLGQTTPFSQSRKYQTYKQALEEAGLTKKFDNIAEFGEFYMKKNLTTKAKVDFFKEMPWKSGLEVADDPRYKAVQHIPGLPKPEYSDTWYLPKDLANEVDSYFNPKEPSKILKVTGKINKIFQDIKLNAGTMFTPANYFGLSQGWKEGTMEIGEILTGQKNPFKAHTIPNFLRAFSKKASMDFNKENVKYITELQSKLRVATEYNAKDIMNEGILADIKNGEFKEIYDKAMETSTFKRFISANLISTYKEVRNGLTAKGMKEKEAVNIAIETVKKVYGLTDITEKYTGSKLEKFLGNEDISNALKSIFLAKDFKISMSKVFINLGKAIKNHKDPANSKILAYGVGAVSSYVVQQVVNKLSTGKFMEQNPEGFKDKTIIRIPGTEGNITMATLPGVGFMPKTIIRSIVKLARGDPKGAGKQLSSLLNIPLRVAVDLTSNEDFFGNPIYEDDDSIGEAWLKQLKYSYQSAISPFVVGAKSIESILKKNKEEFLDENGNPMEVKDSEINDIIKALELPVGYVSDKRLDATRYYNTKDKYYKKLTPDEQKIYDKLSLKGTDFGSKQRDKVADAQDLVNYPNVLKAIKETAIETAKANNQELDPLYKLTDEQLKTYYQIQGLTSNSKAQMALKAKNEWYSDLSDDRSDYFKKMIDSGKMKAQKNDYPQANPETQKKLDYLKELKTPEIKKKQDYYFTLPERSDARRAYSKANPDLVEYWNTIRAYKEANPDVQAYKDEEVKYYDKVGLAFGIEPEEKTDSSSKWSNWSNWSKWQKKHPNIETYLKKVTGDRNSTLKKDIDSIIKLSNKKSKEKALDELFKKHNKTLKDIFERNKKIV